MTHTISVLHPDKPSIDHFVTDASNALHQFELYQNQTAFALLQIRMAKAREVVEPHQYQKLQDRYDYLVKEYLKNKQK